MRDYPFRLLCKRCNSYRFTTISLVENLIRMDCRRCKNNEYVIEERFGDTPVDEKRR